MSDINTILHMASIYENRCLNGLVKIAKIRKLPEKDLAIKYKVSRGTITRIFNEKYFNRVK